DDAVAILFAARHLDLVGVSTVHGNNTLVNTTRNGLAVLELGKIDVPLAAGCEGPLTQKRVGIASLHGLTGLDGAVVPAPTRKPITTHGVDFIIEMAQRHKGELVLAVVGPQTNAAIALRKEPRLKEWLREITIMGGSTGGGNATPVAEFNIYCDPDAAWTVFECGVPIRMAGYNITHRTGFDERDIARLKASGKLIAGTMAGLMQFYLEKQRATFGYNVAPMHDVCSIIPYVDPSLITFANTSVRVELNGTLTRGMTVCDLRTPIEAPPEKMRNRQPPNALVAIDVQSRKLIDLVLDTLLSYH
ncbi:MAG: nucleoside hydrolase, partial [Hyphomicrobiaceae bacterium]